MAREISEIKAQMTKSFVENETVRSLYDLEEGKSFEEQFSNVSLESIIFYIVAFGMHTLERIFDTHKAEVNGIIENIMPHRPKWYRDKALNFIKDKVLINETDKYDTADMNDDEITSAKIVKYAAALEVNGFLLVKIATGEPGSLQPIKPEEQIQFEAYMNEIRDAGVRIEVVNQPGDYFDCKLNVYYDSIMLASDVRTAVKDAIKAYLQGLPFNGEYSNMALTDAVQAVEGVRIVEVKSANARQTPTIIINDKITPDAGYFTYNEENININMIAYSGE